MNITNHKPCIICVDDEEIVLQSLKIQLEESFKSQYDIELANSGSMALEIVDDMIEEGRRVHLIICDMIMPNMKGDELLAVIKKKSPDTVSILLTGLAEKEDVVNAINNAGLYKYIAKPWTKFDLIENVKEAIEFQRSRKENNNLVSVNEQLISQLVEKTELIERQKLELTDLVEFKNKLISIISHDIRGPLASFKGILELMEGKGLSEDDLNQIPRLLSNQVTKVGLLLDSLLEWSMSQAEGFVPHPQFLKLDALAHRNITLYEREMKEKKIMIHNGVPKDSIAFGDEGMVDLVIRNILANAIKFTPERGEIKMETQNKDDKVAFSIIDSGIGLPSELESILFRDKGASRVGTKGELGTGFGLQLCRDLIQKNGGEIWAENNMEVGSTFYFTLPTKNTTAN